MKKSGFMISALALTAWCGTAAQAQQEAPKLTITPGGPVAVQPVGGVGLTFGSRAETVIFSNDGFADITRYLSGVGAGGTLWANDFSVATTPWAGATGRVATGFEWLYFNTGPNGQVMFTRVDFYKGPTAAAPLVEFNFLGVGGVAGTPMVEPTAVPFYRQVWGIPAFNTNTGNFLFARPAGGIAFPDGMDQFWFVKQTFSDAAATLPLPHAAAQWAFTASPIATAANAAGPGVDAPSLARDQNADGMLLGGAVGTDHRQLVLGGQATAPSFSLMYDAPVVAPTPTHDFGCLADGMTMRDTDAFAANGTVWYKFCLNGDATDDVGVNGRFLDMHTHGSGGGTTDTVIALYDNAGVLLWVSDDDGGANTLDFASMLSFGVGRRAAVPATGGDQFDGFGFTGTAKGLPAADGPYWLAVSGFGVAYSAAFGTSGTWAGGGVKITFNTNTNGAALAMSEEPAPAAADQGGVLLSPGLDAIAAQLFAGVRWVSFETCRTTDATNQVVIDYSHCAAGSAWQVALFNDQGNVLTTAVGSPPPTVIYNDTTVLPAGRYWIGISYNFGVDYATLSTTDGRWHMRNRATSNWNAGVQIGVTWTDCATGCYGTCVADFDDGSGSGVPDGGVTIDDLLYYLFIFDQGFICADVDDGSATGTQDGGVTIDDLLYYLFRFDSGC